MSVSAGGYRFAKGNAKYDYSYIHHTYETEWLKKLGYEVVLRWDERGILWS